MEDTYTRICIYSFNSWGFGDDKQDICRLLMLENENFVPILCNQENFLLLNNGYCVKQALPGLLSYIFPKKEKWILFKGDQKMGCSLPYRKK